MKTRGKGKMKVSYDVSLDRLDYLVNPFPLVCIFGLSVDHLEALQNVNDVVDPSSLHCKLSRALVQIEKGLTLTAI